MEGHLLELEVELAFDRPRTKRVIRTPEVRVRDVAVNIGEVYLVEHVEGIRADLEPGVFTQYLHGRQTK